MFVTSSNLHRSWLICFWAALALKGWLKIWDELEAFGDDPLDFVLWWTWILHLLSPLHKKKRMIWKMYLIVCCIIFYIFFSQKKRWTAAKPDYCKIPFVSILCAIEQVPWLVTCQCTNTAYRSTRAIIPIRSAIDNINGKKIKLYE